MRIISKKYIYAAVLALGVAGTACNKDLEQLPNNSVTPDLVFSTIAGAETAFNGMYAPLYSQNYYGRNFTLIPDLLTENLIAGSWFSNSYSDIIRWSYHSGGGEGRGLWQLLYGGLHRINTFLVNIDKVKAGEGEDPSAIEKKKAEFKAQALALRALYMFDLTRFFCKLDLNDPLGLPYVLEPTIDVMHARKTVKETYDQIEKDLKDAAAAIGETNVGKQTVINKYFIAALQSRFYLYFGKNAESITASDIVLSGSFGFEADSAAQSKVWINDAGTKEIIFKIGIDPVRESGNVNLGVLFINDVGGSQKPNPDFIPSKELVNLFATEDLRRGFYFKRDSARQLKDSIWIVKKYPGNPAFAAQSDKANAPKLFRYAEIVLNKMEALYPTDKAGAKALLKSIRVSRIKGYNAAIVDGYDDATLLQQIRIERQKELAFEGHRWFDLKRWGLSVTKNREGSYQALESAVGTIAADNYHWSFPIPAPELQSNKLAKQNPGYTN